MRGLFSFLFLFYFSSTDIFLRESSPVVGRREEATQGARSGESALSSSESLLLLLRFGDIIRELLLQPELLCCRTLHLPPVASPGWEWGRRGLLTHQHISRPTYSHPVSSSFSTDLLMG